MRTRTPALLWTGQRRAYGRVSRDAALAVAVQSYAALARAAGRYEPAETVLRRVSAMWRSI
ncbi:hypothetical protein GCM10010278_73500 [Streptomyces melanogenes]|nr:hypothetical protein GCM10010278_73500 [Streptomyces melanogenes]